MSVISQLNKVDSEGNTPLLIASRDGDIEEMEDLIRRGSDVNHLNKNRQKAVDIVWEMLDDNVRYYECMFLLLEAGSPFPEHFDSDYLLQSECTPDKLKSVLRDRLDLHECIRNCEVTKVQELDKVHDVRRLLSATNDWPIHTAAEYSNEDMLAVLLRQPLPVSPEEIKFSGCEDKLLQQVNGRGETALLSAARAGKIGNVSYLLRYGADISFCSQGGNSAIDLAWKAQHYDVVVLLLEADSHFPDGFQLEHISGNSEHAEKLKLFVEKRNALHVAINSGDIERVKEYFEEDNNSFCKYYLNSESKSALYTAVDSLQFPVYAFLKSKGACFKGNLEEEGLYSLDTEHKVLLKECLLQYFPKVKGSHLQFLVSKSKTTQPYENFQKRVYDIFKKLDEIKEVSHILEVIQFSDYMEIIFDFDQSNVSHADPVHGQSTKGTTDYNDGRIYVGFKVDSPEDELEHLGTLAHELTHLAMQIVYHNKCNPYFVDDKERAAYFHEVTAKMQEMCNQSDTIDDILKRVFSYSNDEQYSELIVRVPHILATHGDERGRIIIEQQAEDLFVYFNKYVMEDCKIFVEQNYLVRPRHFMRVLNQYLGQVTAIENANIDFEFPKDLSDFVGASNKHIIMVLKTANTWLSTINVFKAVQELLHSSLKSSTLFLKLTDFESYQDDIFYSFKSQACRLMVVECHKSFAVETITRVLQLTMNLLCERKKIIFIVNSGSDGMVFQKIIKDKKLISKVRIIVDDEYSLYDLCVNSQNIIMNQEILFQGINVQLFNVVDEETKMCIDSRTLTDLICKRTVKLGEELASLGDVEHYYISRSFNSMEEISEKILTGTRIEDVLFVSGSAELTGTTNVVHQPAKDSSLSEEDQFVELNKIYPDSNIHWLKYENEKLLWVRTMGSVSRLQEFRRFETTQQFSEDVLLEQNNYRNVTILCDTAGMGKSTVLIVIAKKLKAMFPYIWVIRINLNDYLVPLREIAEKLTNGFSTDNSDDVFVDFFVNKLLKFQTEFEKHVFESMLKEGRVAVLCDGFDEISPDYKDIVVELLLVLNKLNLKELFVTTRPYVRNILEEKFGVFSLTLESFSPEDRKAFLIRFWKNSMNMSDDDMKEKYFPEYVRRLISSLKYLVNDKLMTFTGIPLQMKMIAEIFPKDCSDLSAANDEVNVPSNLDLVSLYKLFIRKKYDVYKLEKTKHFTVAADVLVELNFKKFVYDHQLLSVKYLFNEKQHIILLSKEQLSEVADFINKIELGMEKTGIVDGVYLLGEVRMPNFVHRSFAEYFASEFIVAKLEEVHIEEIKQFIMQDFFVSENHIALRAFFNNHITAKCLPEAVLEAYGETMQKLWLQDYNSVCVKNQGTAIHEAVENGHREIIEFFFMILKKHPSILKCMINVVNEHSFSALDYGIHVGNLEIVGILLDKGADYDLKNAPNNSILHKTVHGANPKLIKAALCKIVQLGTGNVGCSMPFHKYVEYVSQIRFNYMISDNVDVSNMTDFAQQAFEEAARLGTLVAVQLVINVGVDDSLFVLLEFVNLLLLRHAARITGDGCIDADCCETTGSGSVPAAQLEGASAISHIADLYLELQSDHHDEERVRVPGDEIIEHTDFCNAAEEVGIKGEILERVLKFYRTQKQLTPNPSEVELIHFLLQRGAHIITKRKSK